MNHEIQLDRGGQVFVHDPVGYPSTPIDVTIAAPNGVVEHATIGAIEIDRYASTLVDDSAIGAPWLTIGTTAGLAIGCRYMIGDPPHHEWATVTELDGVRVSLRQRLANAFGAGTTIRGCRLSIAVDPDWQRAQARRIELGGVGVGAYSVTWSYQIDGVVTRAVDHVDLVFTSRADVVTPDDVERRHPGWLKTLPTDRASRGTEVILEAHDLVQRDAARAKVELNNVVETRELVELRARMVTLEQEVLYGKRAAADLDAAEARYQRRAAELWSKLHRGAPVPRIATKTSRPEAPLDDLRRWLETSRSNGMSQWQQLQVLRETWLPRLRSPRECLEAARLIREFITSRRLLAHREALLGELA